MAKEYEYKVNGHTAYYFKEDGVLYWSEDDPNYKHCGTYDTRALAGLKADFKAKYAK